MAKEFPGGVWPVMLTPFTEKNEVDYEALEILVDWYINKGVSGLFAVCQSSEMFQLSLKERIAVAKAVVKASDGRIPVIASGHISESLKDQGAEITRMAETGVEAVILITNRLAKKDEGDDVWQKNCEELLERIPPDIPLGFYECPYPYKRILSEKNIRWCLGTERFYFLKDTCCDIMQITEKLSWLKESKLKLYNANTSTLLESLKIGAAGYSGVMANFHPELYVWLCKHFMEKKAQELSDQLSMMSLIERQYYPVNAKYFLADEENLPISTICRVQDESGLTETFKKEVDMLSRVSDELVEAYDVRR